MAFGCLAYIFHLKQGKDEDEKIEFYILKMGKKESRLERREGDDKYSIR